MTTIARKNWIENKDSGETVVHKNDIWLENGDFAYCSGYDCYAQTIEAVIKTISREIQTFATRGVPYFRTVFNNNRSLSMWAAGVRTEVSGLDFVSSINDFTYEYNFPEKKLEFVLTVQTKDGKEVRVDSELE